jgi:hypothetical protein
MKTDSSLRFVQNDSCLRGSVGVVWGWFAASQQTNSNQLPTLELACHSEQSEESKLIFTGQQ